eukprot:UN02443
MKIMYLIHVTILAILVQLANTTFNNPLVNDNGEFIQMNEDKAADDGTISVTLSRGAQILIIVVLAIFVLCNCMYTYCLIRHRRRESDDDEIEGEPDASKVTVLTKIIHETNVIQETENVQEYQGADEDDEYEYYYEDE